MTVAMSLLIHGEAVRFNRGQSRGDDFDFKYLRGRDGNVYPYVSSQCYKRYWRESLRGPFSPITREKDKAGNEKNQAFTAGNPIEFIDDDLFGYMIAGATDTDDDGGETGVPEEDEEPGLIFSADNLKDPKALKEKLLDGTALSTFILQTVPGAADELRNLTSKEDLEDRALRMLDEAARNKDLVKVEGLKATRKTVTEFNKSLSPEEIRKLNRDLLLRALSKHLQEKPKRDTTKRTAPVRMHALVAFSGIKTAKDFQTFSRDVAYTGKNSIVNPAAQGIYSGWLKTRILIESDRIGKFYVGRNLDILKDQVNSREIKREPNPYSRGNSIEYVQIEETQRCERLRAALKALADIGNRQGPASGALHDGSLRPKAFVAGMMNCADSPFDYIWLGRSDDGVPYLDVNFLCEAIRDWEDLFATRKIYIGLAADAGRQARPNSSEAESAATTEESAASELEKTIKEELARIKFEAVVDTPRRALLRLAQEATL